MHMFTKTALLGLLLILPISSLAAENHPKTVVTSQTAKRMLLGRHMFSLQWVSWDRFGRVDVIDRNGTLHIEGEQKAPKGGDYVTIDGIVTRVDAKAFTFEGEIVTRVSHINGGEPCVRKGEFTFAATGSRKYWRLQQMDNPCDPVVDYVDVFFRRR